MSSEYSYDEQGQFFPFYILTIVALITLPLTYGLLAPSTDAAATATRIQTDYKAPDAELVAKLRQAQKRRQRKIKRIVFVVIGWLVMALMVYLIMVRARTTTKIWNPYDILGISEVRVPDMKWPQSAMVPCIEVTC